MFQPGSAAANVFTKVELSIRCANLINADFMSKSDPMVVLEQKQDTGWLELGRTETVWDNLNPEFQKKFSLEYHFEMHQMLRFSVYDIDSERRNLSDHDFLGKIEVSLGEIVSAQVSSEKISYFMSFRRSNVERTHIGGATTY